MTVAPDFEQLVDAHYAALYRFALSLSRNESEAADLTQQTFYLWASKGHQLRDPAQAKTWLFTALYREFLALRRRDERLPSAELDGAAEEICAEPPSPNSFDSVAVLDALGRLDPCFRAPLALFYLQDLSYREIAEVLQIPAGTVMSRLARGKAELRRHLVEYEKIWTAKMVSFSSVTASAKKHE
jgi:RNA polymerase sigma-70 factor, ECF subfamily